MSISDSRVADYESWWEINDNGLNVGEYYLLGNIDSLVAYATLCLRPKGHLIRWPHDQSRPEIYIQSSMQAKDNILAYLTTDSGDNERNGIIRDLSRGFLEYSIEDIKQVEQNDFPPAGTAGTILVFDAGLNGVGYWWDDNGLISVAVSLNKYSRLTTALTEISAAIFVVNDYDSVLSIQNGWPVLEFPSMVDRNGYFWGSSRTSGNVFPDHEQNILSTALPKSSGTQIVGVSSRHVDQAVQDFVMACGNHPPNLIRLVGN